MYPEATKNEQLMLSKAIRIATEGHLGQFDMGGHPYILHTLAVMFRVRNYGGDITAQCIAVLHDLLEDNAEWTAERLLEEGMSQDVVDGISLMKHDKGVDYFDYIEGMKNNIRVLLTKKSDIEENFDIRRLKGLREKDFARQQKYSKAYKMIEMFIYQHNTTQNFKRDHL